MYCSLPVTALSPKNSCNQCNKRAVKTATWLQINWQSLGDHSPTSWRPVCDWWARTVHKNLLLVRDWLAIGNGQGDWLLIGWRWAVIDWWPVGDLLKDLHDDVIKWKPFLRYWSFMRGIHRWPVNSPHKGQWHGALMFSLICAWINNWVSNREAGDLRCHHTHYDITVMSALGQGWQFQTRAVIYRGIKSMFTHWGGY